MSLPTLPTDNLYKFMAIAGLVLFVLSVYFPLKISEELEIKQIRLTAEIEKFSLDIENRREESLSIQEEGFEEFRVEYGDSLFEEYKKMIESNCDISTFKEFFKQLPVVSRDSLYKTSKLDSTATYDRIKRNLLLLNKVRQDKITVLKLGTKNEELGAIIHYRNIWTRIYIMGGVYGLFISIFGFVLWYVKLQRLQDRLLKKQLGNRSTRLRSVDKKRSKIEKVR